MTPFKTALYGLTTIFAFFVFPTLSLSQVSLDGEFRPRTEYREGYRLLQTDNTDPAFFTSQRSRISLDYKTDHYKVRFSGQDVRVWGDVEQLQSNANVNVHEAWTSVNISETFAARVGRQELVYDDHRLLGSVNWTQQARSHDALVLKFHDRESDFKIDVGGAYNQESEKLLDNSYSLNNYKALSYLWVNKQFNNVGLSAIGLTDGFERASGATKFRYTYGTHVTYNNDGWDASGTLYLQRGQDATRNDISAWMYSLLASRNVGIVRFTAGYDHLSGGAAGDRDPARHSFNTLYATNHKFYGTMDYFLNVPGDTRGGGLQDLYFKVNYRLAENAGIDLAYHYFAFSGAIADPTTPGQSLDKNLGSELDLSISCNFTSDVAFKAGYSLLIPSESLERIQGVQAKDFQHWGWAVLSVTPNFLD